MAKNKGVNLARRALLFRGVGLGAGALAGEGILRGVGMLATDSIRALERAVNEFFIDLRMVSGELEEKIKLERRMLEGQLAEHRDRLSEMGLPKVIDEDSVEELITNLSFIQEKYTLAERITQFRDRLHQRLLSIDSFLENAQPDVFRQVDDVFRGLHGMPTGSDYRRHRKGLEEKLSLLTKAYSSAEETRRLELGLAEEINGHFEYLNEIVNDPELREMADEFADAVRERLSPPSDLRRDGAEEDELRQLPELSPEQITILRNAVESLLERAEALNLTLAAGKRVQTLLTEGELLIQDVRSAREERLAGDTVRQRFRRRAVSLEQDVEETLRSLHQFGLQISSRKAEINRDTVTTGISNWFGDVLAGPVHWLAIGAGGLIGYLVGARVSKVSKPRERGRAAKAAPREGGKQ